MPPKLPTKRKSSKPPAVPPPPFPVAGVGASAGGLEAFTRLLQHLPADTGIGFVVIQHLDPAHPSILTELLTRETAMPVEEAHDGVVVGPNRVYVMPPNTSMEWKDGKLRLVPRDEAKGQFLPIDCFFRSIAEECGSRAIGVVLSGTASDGALGIAAIKAAGGITFAQDEKSAKFAGMPRSAVASGSVDYTLPPAAIAAELGRIGSHPYVESAEPPPVGEDDMDRILVLLRKATGVDFAAYKQNTIRRRVLRRMLLMNAGTIADYLRNLADDPREVQALFDDILINVTEFFRDPESFTALKTLVWPGILNERPGNAPIRIWVPGCSTGEEVYSIAMCLLEFLDERKVEIPAQIFATDVSEAVIGKARMGSYPENISADVTPGRLRRFFIKVDRGYEISKRIRELCVFARHNLIKDPPFSKLDLISCRNVLIYLGSPLQKRIVPILHYALKPGGFLMLGVSETVGTFSDLFRLVDPKNKVYTKKLSPVRASFVFQPSSSETRSGHKDVEGAVASAWSSTDLQREADRLVIANFAPPGVLIDDQMNILQFRGQTSPWLEPAPGAASLNLVKMAREGMLVDLRAAIQQARSSSEAVRKEGVRVIRDRESHTAGIEVVPVKNARSGQSFFLVLFRASEPEPKEPLPNGPADRANREPEDLLKLRQDLTATKDYLEAIIEEQEASNEELRTANEEIQSSNEELQSTNEELETAKEELQSTNEELHTVNDELEHRNAELARLNDDLGNLLSSVNLPVVMLDNDRKIRSFTPPAGKVLNLIPSDIGRPMRDIKPNIDVPRLDALLLEVIETLHAGASEVQDANGKWYEMRIRPYKTADNRIDGVVLVLVEIDELKHTLDDVRTSRDFARAIVETVREPLVVLDARLVVKSANPSFYQTFHVVPRDVENLPLYEIGKGQWNIPKLRSLLEEILPRNSRFDDFELEHEFPGLGPKTLLLNARRLPRNGAPGSPQSDLILLAMEDITERKREDDLLMQAHEAELREALMAHDDPAAARDGSLPPRAPDPALARTREELQALTAKLMSVQEDERRRLSRELHDHLNQRLAMLEVEVQSVERGLPAADSSLRDRLRSVCGQVAELSDDVRRVAYQLHPSSLDHLGLAVALRSYCADFSRREIMQVRFAHRNLPDSLPPEIASCLYRVAEEALRNIAKHARTKLAIVSISRRDHRIQLTIRDPGVGFNPDSLKGRAGLGIISMEERVRLAGGKISVRSRPGDGTRVEVVIPLPPAGNPKEI
ncbi:MAG: chemotaxis protein CheB [Bryobacteraceae bacterium]